MKIQTLQYYMHDGPSAFRFELAGDLSDEAAGRLDQDWRTASSVIGDRTLIVDMTFVTSVTERGRALLARWYAEGAQLIAKSKVSRGLAEAIAGEPLPEIASERDPDASRTWLPFRASLGALRRVKSQTSSVDLPARAENTASSSAVSQTNLLHAKDFAKSARGGSRAS
jgi:hypothetical protein